MLICCTNWGKPELSREERIHLSFPGMFIQFCILSDPKKGDNFFFTLADLLGVAPAKKKVDNETNVTFLNVPADLKIYYQYILVHNGRGVVNAFVENGY